jgi:hypothetical protein
MGKLSIQLGTLIKIGRTFGMRNGLLRMQYETQRATGLMSRRMQSVQGWDFWNLKNIVPKNSSSPSSKDLLNIRRQGARLFFFADPRDLKVALKNILGPTGEANTIAEADNILQGNVPFFGRLSFACGFPPQWFQNPATGQNVSPDRPWTTMRFASPDYGDLKFILEPSRFLFVYPLARAYALTADERFPEAFWQAIENWAANNPPMSGPLWICGQESSLRILAWSFALNAFLHSPATTPERTALLIAMIAAHAWRTQQTLGYARSQRSNHLFSEAVGLWTAGTLYPELSDAAAWQEKGFHFLQEAVRDQITPEGAYLQDSFNYHRMVLHQLLWTIRLAEINHIDLDPEIRHRTIAAVEFIAEFVDPRSGRAPNHGSNDGSHIFPLAACDHTDFRPLLRLAEAVLNQPSTLPPGPWDEPALWLTGESESAKKDRSAEPTAHANVTSKAGYHRIGTANSWAFVRAGRYTTRPFQADQLHIDLWWNGLNLVRDPGTYLYNGDPPWNNGLAGTAVHNTVMVDGRDQMRRAGRFLWLDWAQASGKSSSTTNAISPNHFEGQHNGYRNLGVTHRRIVDCVTEDAWIIVDDLVNIVDDLVNNDSLSQDRPAPANHDLQLHWLLPDLRFEVIASVPFSGILSEENARFRWHIFSSSAGTADILRAGKNLSSSSSRTYKNPDEIRDELTDELKDELKDKALFGWESPTYGERRPAISLLYHVRSSLPVRIVTVVLADDALLLQQKDGEIIVSLHGAQLYGVNIKHGVNIKR